MRALLLMLLRGYKRFVSPALPAACRYVPSCSEYAAEAIVRHGAIRGLLLSGWRVLRCNPFSRGGLDLVPTALLFRDQHQSQAAGGSHREPAGHSCS